MLLGIDVGGTFTDAVLIKDGVICSSAKTPTTQGNLLMGILTALDKILAVAEAQEIQRVSLSTTIVTNALVESKTDKVALFLVPGPGLNLEGRLPEEPFILSGYTDHRGRQVAMAEKEEVVAAARRAEGYQTVAVAGKFAVRNPQQEQEIAGWVKETLNPSCITLGSVVSGSLNYLRRINSAYYNSAVWQTFSKFAKAIEDAMLIRGINAPIYVLKADGGTLPLAAAKAMPVEAIFTGPAASVLGIMALTSFDSPAVSLDIGGTTTDIGIWQNGSPVFSPGGARVNGFPTSVRSFLLKSVGIGGDSYVRRENDILAVGPLRCGAAMASGGPEPTLTDALMVAGLIEYGDKKLADQAMIRVASAGQSTLDAAWETLGVAVNIICAAIRDVLKEQAAKPVYKVEDIVDGEQFEPELVIGVGGAALGLVPLVAEKLGLTWCVPKGHTVANAVGAAAARPTTEITLCADTAQGFYTVPELGLKSKLPKSKFTMDDARKSAEAHLAERAVAGGLTGTALDIETLYEEEFNVVRGFSTTGKILTCKLQLKPGVLEQVKAEEVGI